MARLRRRWRILKWAGLVLSLLIAMAWAVSIQEWRWYGLYTCHIANRGHLSFCLDQGCLCLSYWNGAVFSFKEEPFLSYERFADELRPTRLPFWKGWFHQDKYWSAYLPLWMPLLIVAIPTTWLWWRDRRCIPSGHCRKCGYDLTGNVSGVCPECGEKVEAGTALKG
jgi:hypothetical protein